MEEDYEFEHIQKKRAIRLAITMIPVLIAIFLLTLYLLGSME